MVQHRALPAPWSSGGLALSAREREGPWPGVHLTRSSWWAAWVGCPSPVLLGGLGPCKQGDALQQGQGNPCSEVPHSSLPLCSFSLYRKAASVAWRQPRSLLPGLRPLQSALRAAFGACLHPGLLCSCKKARAFGHCLSNVLPRVAAGLEEKGVHVGAGVGDARQK